MLCDTCSKNPASVHLTEIIGGEITEVHLCEECAKKKTEEFGNIFQKLEIVAKAENAELCKKQGVVVERNLDKRDLDDLTSKPPFGGKTIGPLGQV